MRRHLAALRTRIASQSSDGEVVVAAERLVDRLADSAPIRAAFVAANAREALTAIAVIHRWLDLDRGPALHARRGVVLATGGVAPRVGVLLPGQGVPAPRDVGALAARFPEAVAVHARAGIPCEDGVVPASAVQLAIVAASLAALAVVRRLGVTPAFALGHSLGELTALSWAGAFDDGAALRLARARGDAMVTRAQPPGAMAAVDANPELLADLLDGSLLAVACFNAPTRQVVSGASEAVDAFLARAHARGVRATRLDVTGAFHSPLMREAATAFGGTLAEMSLAPLGGRVISSVTGTWLPADVDLREHLRHQMLAPVRFLDAARVAARHADLLIEAGPGSALGSLMAEIAETPVISLNVGDHSPRRLLELVATLWACGITPAATMASLLRDAAGDQPRAPRSRRWNAATISS